MKWLGSRQKVRNRGDLEGAEMKRVVANDAVARTDIVEIRNHGNLDTWESGGNRRALRG